MQNVKTTRREKRQTPTIRAKGVYSVNGYAGQAGVSGILSSAAISGVTEVVGADGGLSTSPEH